MTTDDAETTALEALDVAQDDLDQALRRLGGDLNNRPVELQIAFAQASATIAVGQLIVELIEHVKGYPQVTVPGLGYDAPIEPAFNICPLCSGSRGLPRRNCQHSFHMGEPAREA